MRIHHARRRRGANAIEFGLTFPVFFVIAFGMFEFGWFFSRQAIVNTAAMDGCREGALMDPINPNHQNPSTAAVNRMTDLVEAGGLACSSCTATIQGAIPDETLQCTVVASYTSLTGLIPMIPNQVRARTTARMEWQR